MKFHLLANRVETLEIKSHEINEDEKNKFDFTHKCLFDESRNDEFMVSFDFHLNSAQNFSLFLKHNFIFKCSEPVAKEFLESHYTSVNAPAIAYPYLRALVATILLNSGLESVTLPAINFAEHAKNSQK